MTNTDNTTKPELLPCPFCAEDKELHIVTNSVDGFTMQCLTCGSEGPSESSESEAVTYWNRRP